MPCMIENDRLRVIGMLEAVMPQNKLARQFGVHFHTINAFME